MLSILIIHYKYGDSDDEVPFYEFATNTFDISHLDKQVDMALNHYNLFIKPKRFNFRKSTIRQINKCSKKIG